MSERNLEYYNIVKTWLDDLTSVRPMSSILDIGAGDTWISTWGNFNKRYAIDIECEPDIPNVEGIQIDWLDCDFANLSIITCLQVVEHLEWPDATKFIDKIFKSTDIAIFSLPLYWPQGACEDHYLDPIDLPKIKELFNERAPKKVKITIDAYHAKGLRFVGMWRC